MRTEQKKIKSAGVVKNLINAPDLRETGRVTP